MELPHNPADNASFGWVQALASALRRKPAAERRPILLLPAPGPCGPECCA